ncbi:hypothetical protein JZ785_16400 [Alicyclobacillus curvatus]|nr:hypothetical protein JZ785_16400 [Alicyclobacillus curvatus]
MLMLAGASLASLRYCSDLHTLETVCLFLFGSASILQTFSIVVYCFRVINMEDTVPSLLSTQLQFGLIIPSLMVHVIHISMRQAVMQLQIVSFLGYLLLVCSVFVTDRYVHILELADFTLLWVIVVALVLLTFTIVFAVSFRELLKRRSIL